MSSRSSAEAVRTAVEATGVSFVLEPSSMYRHALQAGEGSLHIVRNIPPSTFWCSQGTSPPPLLRPETIASLAGVPPATGRSDDDSDHIPPLAIRLWTRCTGYGEQAWKSSQIVEQNR